MQTVLIIGSTAQARNSAIAQQLRSWNISVFDRISPADESLSIGIADIRVFIKKLAFTPHEGSHIAGIIENSEKLSIEAQQALLKTLEEPPIHAYIIMGIPNTALLLPTIISRCMCVNLQDTVAQYTPEQFQKNAAQLHTLITASPGKRVAILSTLGTTKEDLGHWIDEAIGTLRNEILEHPNSADNQPTKKRAHLVHALIETRKYRENNVNLLLLLERAFLTLPMTSRHRKYG
ncbi:MAG: hypothetical protein AAB542_00685 [Patescibacteria group bacterium]